MQSNKEILEELRMLSMVVAGIGRLTPYEAPEGYFADLPGRVSALLHQESPALSSESVVPESLSRDIPFSVPAGYFEGFSSRVLERIRSIEPSIEPSIESSIEPSSALLDSIGKEVPYHVPEGYFEAFPTAVLSAVTAPAISAAISAKIPAPAKVISIGRRRNWLKYAVAAVAMGIILTGGWLRLHAPAKKAPAVTVDLAQSLSGISDQDIQSYVDNHTNQIQQYDALDNTTASLDITDNDVKSFLGDVSDNELTEYLEEHGNAKDFPTN